MGISLQNRHLTASDNAFLRQSAVAVFFGGHACCTLEIAVERCRFSEAEHKGGFLKRRCGMSLNQPFGLHGIYIDNGKKAIAK